MEIVKHILIVLIAALILALLLALPTAWLWNWLMPSIFGLREITFLEALGLNVLSAILLKPSISSSKKED